MATANYLIDRAYTLIGYKDMVEPLQGQEYSYALNLLNDMIDSWNTQNLFIVSTVKVTTNVSASPVTIGPAMTINVTRPVSIADGCFIRVSNVDYPLEQITRVEYNDIVLKASTSTIPLYFYYEDTLPTGNIYLYPAPSGTVSLNLQLRTTLSVFANLTTDYPLAPGYSKAITYSLGEELATGLRELPPRFYKQADLARRVIRRSNLEIPLLSLGHGTQMTTLQRGMAGL